MGEALTMRFTQNVHNVQSLKMYKTGGESVVQPGRKLLLGGDRDPGDGAMSS